MFRSPLCAPQLGRTPRRSGRIGTTAFSRPVLVHALRLDMLRNPLDASPYTVGEWLWIFISGTWAAVCQMQSGEPAVTAPPSGRQQSLQLCGC
ncbi:hypothetical protein V5799_018516 [Amblyomma americanum]|uniref:Uncharacterized protein n=1 Tax=Amblyomma americanum TaxID=6943 RepID=A0AAQ4F060_AMBAM